MAKKKHKNFAQLNIWLPEHQRDQLRKLAAERMISDPKKLSSAAQIVVEIISLYLDGVKREGGDE